MTLVVEQLLSIIILDGAAINSFSVDSCAFVSFNLLLKSSPNKNFFSL